MVATSLMFSLLSKVTGKYRFVFVGDVYQLPSIDHGQVLKDIIDSEVFPVAFFTKSFRFDDGIGQAARAILHGVIPEFGDKVQFIECDKEIILDHALKMADKNSQVLSPIKEGDNGTKSLCRAIAKKLYPNINRVNGVGVGDTVINTKNDYEHDVFNGERGRVVAVTDRNISVRYDSGTVEYSQDDKPIVLSYALTVHKCQGQEYSNVIIVLPPECPIMLQRQLIYTAVTRAKEKVIIIGTRKGLETVLSNQFEIKRITGLKEHLKLD